MAAILRFILLTLTLLVVRYSWKISRNYIKARKTGLRVVIAPIDDASLLYTLLFTYAPNFLRLFHWAKVGHPTFVFGDPDKYYRELGLNYMLVSPNVCCLHTSDPHSVDYALRKFKTFTKPWVYENMEFYGKNVDTVNGEDWNRHRKLTGPCFNERVSGFVWDESLRQARSMLEIWLSKPDGIVSRMVDDTRIIALHVLTAAGLGISHDFQSGVRDVRPGHALSHRDSLMTVLDNLTLVVIMSNMGWIRHLKRFIPKIHDVALAFDEFAQYMEEMLVSERKIMANDKRGISKPNLLSTLIRTSDAANVEGHKSAVRLTDDEIKGNVFIFNLAGHDTTANTLAYAFALLAVYPEIQAWVVEEIDSITNDVEDLEYEKMFPRLKRTLAVMYETLRHYGPVPTMPRVSLGPDTPLLVTSPKSPDKTEYIVLPENTAMSIDLQALHASASSYPLPRVWNPKRWIQPSTTLSDEKFLSKPLGFAGWSGGSRICPGMKFAQVEFVAVLTTVLRAASVGVVVGDQEAGALGEEKAKKEMMELLNDSGLVGPTLSLKRPDEVRIRVTKRSVG